MWLLVAVAPPGAAQSNSDHLVAPVVAGIALGDSAGAVPIALGEPSRRQVLMGLVAWDYLSRGLTVMWDREERKVRVLVLSRRGGGDVNGVRVGDSTIVVAEHWGPPARVRQDGRFQDFVRRGWTVSAEVRQGVVVEITVQLAE